jgi:hypothetical protein
MTRRKREITGLANEQDFPHLVELAVPPEGFGRGFLDFDAVLFPRNVEPHRVGFENRRDLGEFLTGGWYHKEEGVRADKRQAAGPWPAARFSARPRNGQAARTANAIPTNETPARTRFALLLSGAGLRCMWRSR